MEISESFIAKHIWKKYFNHSSIFFQHSPKYYCLSWKAGTKTEPRVSLDFHQTPRDKIIFPSFTWDVPIWYIQISHYFPYCVSWQLTFSLLFTRAQKPFKATASHKFPSSKHWFCPLLTSIWPCYNTYCLFPIILTSNLRSLCINDLSCWSSATSSYL